MLASCAVLAAAALPLFAGAASDASTDLPPASDNLRLAAPIDSWDEAVPLGNGLLGCLLWGRDRTLRVSLDRGDLWDERPAVDKDWWRKHTWTEGAKRVAAGDAATVNAWWDSPYNGVTPTKLPAGRLEIDLPVGAAISSFELRLASALGAVSGGGGEVLAFTSASAPVTVVRVPGAPTAVRLMTPLQVLRRARGGDVGPSGGGSVDRLGYPDAVEGTEGGRCWYVQQAAEGLRYCVLADSRPSGNSTLVVVTVCSTADGPDPIASARARCDLAHRKGWGTMLREHERWWRRFWSTSSLQIPDDAIRRQYLVSRYLYGAGSRRGAPPMPLQGVWTADTGALPPWKGDYHNDLNTQMTYIAYQAAGHFDEGSAYLDLLWRLKPAFRDFARGFYGTGGLATPGVMSLAGQPLGGWGQYSLSPTMTSWNAHLFYLHWRYTADAVFLRTRAYPWCREAGDCMKALLKPDGRGVLTLPLSSSPEVHDNSAGAWLRPNSNYDLMCLRMHFLALAEMADALGRTDEVAEWSRTAAALGSAHTGKDRALLLDAEQPLPYSHRHLSNLIGIHPFNLITVEGSDEDRAVIAASLAQWDHLGTSAWCGYSFGWMAALRARVGDADAALRNLSIFTKAFVLRNGFHANGDQTRSGYSSFTYRPFTLEGNFVALQALQEMLLQSWSATPGRRDTEVIRVFPATPAAWPDVSFRDLRVEGGHRVSARRVGGATQWLAIVAGRDGDLRIRDNFGGRRPSWSRPRVRREGDHFVVHLRKGEAVEAAIR